MRADKIDNLRIILTALKGFKLREYLFKSLASCVIPSVSVGCGIHRIANRQDIRKNPVTRGTVVILIRIALLSVIALVMSERNLTIGGKLGIFRKYQSAPLGMLPDQRKLRVRNGTNLRVDDGCDADFADVMAPRRVIKKQREVFLSRTHLFIARNA